jgi:hypothetical protein
VELNNNFFKLGNSTALISWGIFNPFGPSLIIIGINEDDEKTCELIWFRMLNPFGQENWLLAQCDNEYEMDVLSLLKDILSKNGNDEFVICKSMPTFILHWSELIRDKIQDLFWLMYQTTKDDIQKFMNYITESKGNPWDRASIELQFAIKKSDQKKVVPKEKILMEWLEKILEPDYFRIEIAAFIDAWIGSIDYHKEKGSLVFFENVMDYPKFQNETAFSGISVFNN